MGQVAADVVDGEILFAQGDDTVAEGIGLGCGMGTLGRCAEEVVYAVLLRVAEFLSRFGTCCCGQIRARL